MKLNSNKHNSGTRVMVMIACFCMVFVCLGFCSSNKSLYLSAITQALNIKRSLFSVNDSCRFAATAVVNLFFGRLIQRFGAKKLVCAGFIALIISTVIYAFASNVAIFYIGGVFLGVGLAWTTTSMVGYLVNRWYKENRGTISGLVLCANGLGGAVAAHIMTPVIYEEENAFGYRNAYLLTALFLLITGIFVVLLVREPSEEIFSGGETKRKSKNWHGISMKTALRKPYFYAASVCVFLTGMSLQGINGIAAAHLGDMGIDAGYVAAVLGIHSIVLCGAKFLAGLSYEKLGLRMTLIICELCGLVSFLALAFSGTDAFGRSCAYAWAVLSALALPLETVMIPLITSDLFGERDFSKLVGIFVSINTIGYAIGAPAANIIYDISGTYQPMLYLISIIMMAIIVSFNLIINSAEKERGQALQPNARQ